ncbi:MAG: acyl-CoA dehydrogenase [Desulfobacterota bacterium]|nr:acyl-CoA dehydrogenase [Thermodesulfobacteriota bacterium]
MPEKFVSERNIKFMLYEVFDAEALTRYEYYAEHGREIFDLVLDTALKMGRDILQPLLREMDQNPPQFVNGAVKVHPMVRDWMRTCGEGGWISALAPYEYGGQQLPLLIGAVTRFIFSAANYSASVYPLLTAGAAHLIESFAAQELKDLYIPKMYAGEWQGTMALTEPQAGSSLSDLSTLAEPTDQGYYLLRGQKIFISASDHDGVDNIVNLLLARIKGAPSGVKGISLFVAPKFRPEADGSLTANDIQVAGSFHKLGYRGSPICQLSLGENSGCRGFLVGEPHQGLAYMFQMMNEARIDVGMSAAAIASAAYCASLQYAKERPQGRRLTSKDPTLPPVPIIEHADVKRMLLFQRAVVEGSFSLLLQCTVYADRARVLSGDDKEKNELLLDLLTPVAKTYPSEMGVLSVSQGLQILGGYGYCDEFPLELFYRDARIHPIHEGTTGIHGLDLLGRKMVMKGGKAAQLYLQEVEKTISLAREVSVLAPYAGRLQEALGKLREVTARLVQLSQEKGPEYFLADATLYLELFGIIAVGWQWLVQASVVQKTLKKGPSGEERNFYQGKLQTFFYFFHYELPKIEGLARRLLEGDGLTVETKPEMFE